MKNEKKKLSCTNPKLLCQPFLTNLFSSVSINQLDCPYGRKRWKKKSKVKLENEWKGKLSLPMRKRMKEREKKRVKKKSEREWKLKQRERREGFDKSQREQFVLQMHGRNDVIGNKKKTKRSH